MANGKRTLRRFSLNSEDILDYRSKIYSAIKLSLSIMITNNYFNLLFRYQMSAHSIAHCVLCGRNHSTCHR